MKASEVLKNTIPFFETETLFNIVNKFKREFYIKVQDRVFSQLMKLAGKYPEPERHLVRKPNSHVWLDILEEYLEYEKNPRIKKIVNAVKRIFIAKIESSNRYWERVEFLVELIAKKYNDGSFKKRKPHTPFNEWSEPSVLEAKSKIITRLSENLK